MTGHRPALQTIHVISAWLLVAAITVQVFLAGLAMYNFGGNGDFGLHINFGYTAVGLVALATVVTAVLAGMPRRNSLISLGLLVLYVVQTSLPAASSSFPAIAALHPVNALLLFGGAVWYARRASRRTAEERPTVAARQPELEAASR